VEKEIELKNVSVKYLLKKSKRARWLRLAVYCDGSFVVTAPDGLNFEKIEEFILEKAEWVLEKLKIMKKRNNEGLFRPVSRNEYRKFKNQALKLAEEGVEFFNREYGFSYNRISIRNQKTRWGSCSRNGNLSYNCKIFLFSKELADYVIVHELCHLREFNHSKKFWLLVKKTIPNYKEIVGKIRNV